MQIIKHVALISVFIALAFSLGACAKEEGAVTTPPAGEIPEAEPEQPVTITWSFWGNLWEVDVNNRVIKVFEADYPNIKVEILHESWPTYFDKAGEWFTSDNFPNVMFLENIPIYTAKGLLENLDPYIHVVHQAD